VAHREDLVPIGLRPPNLVADLQFQFAGGGVRFYDGGIQSAMKENSFQSCEAQDYGQQTRPNFPTPTLNWRLLGLHREIGWGIRRQANQCSYFQMPSMYA
jgi:hypothetical protein